MATSMRSRELDDRAAAHLPEGAYGIKSSGRTKRCGLEVADFWVNVFSASPAHTSAISSST